MKEELIKFETAKLAKEKGFDIESNGHAFFNVNGKIVEGHIAFSGEYENLGLAPTQSFLQRWLREEHDIKLNLETTNRVNSGYICRLLYPPKEWSLMSDKYRTFTPSKGNIEYKSYEQALEVGLQEALKLIKSK